MRNTRTQRCFYSRSIALIAIWVSAGGLCHVGTVAIAQNVALQAAGAQAKSWEPGVRVVPEHEPSRVNDGSVRTYWTVQSEDLPADIGVEWPAPQQITSVVVRYVDGRMVSGPGVARTQEWAELQYWSEDKWISVEHQIYGEETSGVRYTFAPVTTTRLRLLFTEPPDPESRRSPGPLGIYVSELEVYRKTPFQVIASPAGTIERMTGNTYTYLRNYNEALGGDASFDRVGPTIVEPKQVTIFRDTIRPTFIVAETRRAQQSAVVQKQGSHEFRLGNGFLELDLSADPTLKESRLKAMHWGDFVEIWPCDGTQPGNLAGKYSIYTQGQQVLRFAQELHDASPGIMLGADGGITNPQYVRFADSRSYGVIVGGQNPYGYDHYPAVSVDIHTDRLYGELNRNYFWDLHTLYLRPSYRLLNIVDHYAHDQTFNYDRAGFRYSLLSGLAMSAQVTFNDIPPEMPDSETEFARKWLNWAKANKDYFKEVDRLFDRSVHHSDQWRGDLGSLDGFAHIRSDRGFIFLINSDAVAETAELELKLDGPASAQFRVSDVYPESGDLDGPDHGNYMQGGMLRVTVPAKQIRILWIAPASSASQKPTPPLEDVSATVPSRFIGNWTQVSSTPGSVTLKATFEYPVTAASDLSRSVADSLWSKEPWAYDKAYLVFQVQDETETSMANFVPNDLLDRATTPTDTGTGAYGQTGGASTGGVRVNGVYKTLHSFQVTPGLRGSKDGFTRCFFVDLEGEVKPGHDNDVEIVIPIERGLVFSGAYLDLPDQMPLRFPPEQLTQFAR